MQEKNYKVKINNDPGRYLCNYIYFTSIHHAHNDLKSASLFIHVPEFDEID